MGDHLAKHIVHRDFVQRRHVLKGMQKIPVNHLWSKVEIKNPIALLQSFKFRLVQMVN